MSEQRVLSLPIAVLININIMLGAGIFLNTVRIAGPAGALSSFAYLIAGFLMLPLVLSIAKLTALYPSGGFYSFGRHEISPFAGFISAWSYFIGKLASGALMIHFSLALAQRLIPALQGFHLVYLDLAAITFFVFLNTRNIKASSSIQMAFTILKLIPIFFALFVGLYLFDGTNITAAHQHWSGIPSILPFLFYATMGFEAACLLCGNIKNPEKNGPKAIIISYCITLGIAALYQFSFYGALGSTLSSLSLFDASYLYAFPELLKKLMPQTPLLAVKFKQILHLALASSALGGAYGIMFSNTWNIYTLAQNKHLFFNKVFTFLNRHAIPIACVVLEGIIYGTYLLVSGGKQEALQQLSALGVVLAYTISVIALLKAKWKRPTITVPLWLPLLGLVNCSIFIVAAINGLCSKGFSSLIVFSALLALGASMFVITRKQ